MLVPDLGGWRRERMPEVPDAAFFETPPDWVCEILSPSTRGHDLIDERALYFEAGVGVLWLIDPDAPILEGSRRSGGGWVLIGTLEDDEGALEAFEAAPFPLASLWPPRLPGGLTIPSRGPRPGLRAGASAGARRGRAGAWRRSGCPQPADPAWIVYRPFTGPVRT